MLISALHDTYLCTHPFPHTHISEKRAEGEAQAEVESLPSRYEALGVTAQRGAHPSHALPFALCSFLMLSRLAPVRPI